ELLPIRYGRMSISPFTYFRGSATVMAHDLASTPTSGIVVQACGDAHLSNFGGFASPERNLVFDINDFDETLPAPWEWDVKRLAASIVVAGRSNGYRTADSRNAAVAAIRSYRERMAAFATMTHLDVWYSNISVEAFAASMPKRVRKDVERRAQKAVHRDNLQALAKMTSVVDGHVRIVEDPPLIIHHSDEVVGEHLPTMAKAYRSTIRDDLRELLDRYTFVDFARKVVGVGSVGTRCYVVLMEGNHNQDPLFLQFKEAHESVLAPYAGKSKYSNQGRRVVDGQHQIQATSDIFLGWGRVNEVDFYVRQLRDMKTSVEVSLLPPDRMVLYAEVCGWALARAHARSGDAAAIAGYLGNGDTFDEAIADFATAYADQTERDHAVLVDAIKSGKVTAEMGR
ncbi:MAG TPA: DUF2252 domain-containing protein, partial [Thermomicrobiales bacterium]|nr:DUF2252 domain-containing protein [Thermomicrobiales bacterium]